MARRFLPVLAALVLLAGACGDDDDDAAVDDAPSDDAAEVEPEDESGGEDDSAGDASVTIQDFAFDPASIEVDAGTTVSWTNEDGVTHTVTSGADSASDGTFDETADSGSGVEIDFSDPGTYPYFCSIHPSMTGEVVVS
jgi:plastocyanin